MDSAGSGGAAAAAAKAKAAAVAAGPGAGSSAAAAPGVRGSGAGPAAGGAAQQAAAQAAAAAPGPGETGRWLCCLPCYWLRNNHSVHQASLTVAMLLVTSLLVASPVLFLISSAPSGDRGRDCARKDEDGCARDGSAAAAAAAAPAPACVSEQCRLAASRIQAAVSWRADPCRDFYAFACGGWTRDPGRPPAAAFSLSTLQRHVDLQIQHLLSLATTISPFEKLGLFYTSCLRVKERGPDYEPMVALVAELGGLLAPGREPADLTPLVARLLQVNGAPLFDLDLDADPRNRSRLAVFLDLPRRPSAAAPLRRGSAAEAPLGWLEEAASLRPPPTPAPTPTPTSTPTPTATPEGRGRRAQPKASRAYTYMKDSAEEKRLLSLEWLLGLFLPRNMPTPTRTKEAQSILLFASTLSKLFPREKEMRQRAEREHTPRRLNLTELQELYAFVQWQPLLEQVFSRNFSEEEALYVRAPGYMAQLHSLLTHFPKRVVHNGLLMVFARDSLLELADAGAAAGAVPGRGGAGGGGGGGPASDWPAHCARVTIALFARAVSALYVRQFSPADIDKMRRQVTALFERLRATLAGRVRASAWLDEPTREHALAKLHGLRGHFFTWPRLWNSSYVAGFLHDLSVSPRAEPRASLKQIALLDGNIRVHVDPDDFFSNVIRRCRQLRRIPPDVFEHPVPERKWAFPFVVNAFYVRSINSMVIPLAMLTQPTFRPDVPRFVPFATVGLVLAHEMLHAFDLAGIGYAADGAPQAWFSAVARRRLEARLACVSHQYAVAFSRKVAFLGATIDVQFDWNATSNENMADIAALQVAHAAWRAQLAAGGEGQDARLPGLSLGPRQLFFIAAAQSYCSTLSPEEYIVLVEVDHHTPYPERINGMMMNSPAFAEAFKCSAGSPMNPSEKCPTW